MLTSRRSAERRVEAPTGATTTEVEVVVAVAEAESLREPVEAGEAGEPGELIRRKRKRKLMLRMKSKDLI